MKPKEPPDEPRVARPSRVQMADIARLANVSISTVSRALSNHPRLSVQTRERIHELAKSLHYSVDAGAQMLRGKPSQTVAVAFPYHPAQRQHFRDPFFLTLIGSIGDALVDSGYSMLIVAVEADSFERVTYAYETRQAIGTILLGQEYNHSRINELAVRGTPFVVWGARLTDQLYCTVGSANLQGGTQATAHLLDTGARRIAFFGDSTLPEIADRYRGYLEAHRARGLAPDPQLHCLVPFDAAAVRAEAGRLLRGQVPFDGVFAGSDLMALAVIAELQAAGRRVPEDVQVVGFDDIYPAGHSNPPLTTVRQAIDEAGRTLVRQLLARLRGEAIDSVVLPTTLVVRGSTRASP